MFLVHCGPHSYPSRPRGGKTLLQETTRRQGLTHNEAQASLVFQVRSLGAFWAVGKWAVVLSFSAMRFIIGLAVLLTKKNCRLWSETNPHNILKTPLNSEKAPFGVVYMLVASSDLIASKIRLEHTLRSMEIVNRPWSTIFFLIWMTLIRQRCGFNEGITCHMATARCYRLIEIKIWQ